MRPIRSWTFVAALALGLAALSGEASAQSRGGTLVMITQPEPPVLAPYISTSAPIGQISTKIFDGLLEYGFDLKPIPSLATSWDVAPDGKTMTFKLRDDVKFQDGVPFTSADVKFTIMDVMKKVHPRGISTYRDVTDVETPDAKTVIFHLTNPAPYIMSSLSSYDTPILPEHIYGKGDIRNHENANKPIGSGPFRFVEWRRGEFIRLDRNPDYWKKGQPYLDRIVARFIADSGTRTALMEKGEAHVAGFGALPYSDVTNLAKMPTLAMTTKGYEMVSPIVELNFNTRKPPFDNLKVRQAVSMAIDRPFVIDNIWFGYGKPATGPISSNFAPNGIYSSDVRSYSVPDGIAQANKLLDEAGFPRKADGFRFEIVHDLTPYGEEWQRYGEYVQQALGKVGIKVTLRYEDVATWLKRLYTDYDFQLTSNFLYNLADPAIGVHREYNSKSIRPGTVFVNVTGWSSPRTDELMDQATVEPDPAKRNAIYHEFQKLVVEAAPMIWSHELTFPTVYNKKYHDLIISPLGIYASFSSAYLEK